MFSCRGPRSGPLSAKFETESKPSELATRMRTIHRRAARRRTPAARNSPALREPSPAGAGGGGIPREVQSEVTGQSGHPAGRAWADPSRRFSAACRSCWLSATSFAAITGEWHARSDRCRDMAVRVLRARSAKRRPYQNVTVIDGTGRWAPGPQRADRRRTIECRIRDQAIRAHQRCDRDRGRRQGPDSGLIDTPYHSTAAASASPATAPNGTTWWPWTPTRAADVHGFLYQASRPSRIWQL